MLYMQGMIKAKPKPKRLRDGYDPPLLIYLKGGTRAAIRKLNGPRSETQTIRKLVEEALTKA